MAKLTQNQKTNVLPVAIERYLQENNTTQVALANLAGIDKAYVNQIAKGKESIGKAQIADKYYEAIARAIGVPLEKVYWQHFNTINFKIAYTVFEKARKKKIRAGIDGDTGKGKTYASTVCKRQYPANTFLIKCSEIDNTKEFALALAREVGSTTIGTKGTLIKEACRKIRQMGGNPLVLIDEFENSKLGIIPIVKTIADELEGYAGLVVIGIDIQKMLQKGADRRKNGFVQTNRRWSFGWTYLENSIAEDIDLICNELGIYSESVKKWLRNRVNDFDSLRNIITTALEEADESGEEVTPALLNELYPL